MCEWSGGELSAAGIHTITHTITLSRAATHFAAVRLHELGVAQLLLWSCV